jgi:hypothetical protein
MEIYQAGADKNARDTLLKAYDSVPLHDNLKKMKRKYLVAKKDRAKRQRAPKKTPDLSLLAATKFGGATPKFSRV